MLIYRMENDKHVGPFNAEVPGLPKEIQQMMAMCGEHPHMLIEDIVDEALKMRLTTKKDIRKIQKLDGPAQDGLDDIRECEVCGALTLAQAREWFPAKMDPAFAKYGQKLHCYEVPDKNVRQGGHQVVFKRKGAKEVPLDGPPTNN